MVGGLEKNHRPYPELPRPILKKKIKGTGPRPQMKESSDMGFKKRRRQEEPEGQIPAGEKKQFRFKIARSKKGKGTC